SPALPVDAKAASAAATISTSPSGSGSQPKNASAAVATGVRSERRSTGSRTATMMNTPATYTNDVTPSDSIIPRGMLRSGFFTSSATLATFVSPAYETNTKPTVENNPSMPNGKNG